jgi:hypothetical protein
MGDLRGSFPVSMRVRTKHAEKTRVGLWGQSAILKVVWDVTNSKQKRVKKTQKHETENAGTLQFR